jgi:hypothetical protein
MSPTIRSMAGRPYCEGQYKRAPSGVPIGMKNPWELGPATEEAMQSTLDAQYILVDMWRLTTARHRPRAETTSTSQLWAVLVLQFPENHNIVEQSTCKVAHNVLGDSSPNADAEAKLICMSADSMRIIPCPEATAVGVEHPLT